jgi:hypothetical protein
MSQGQKVRPEVVEQIKRVYAELVATRPGGKVTAQAVYKSAKRMLGEDCPKIRRIQQIVKETTPQLQTVPGDPELDLWNAPDLPINDSEGIARLFRLRKTALEWGGMIGQRVLTQRVAKWALRVHRVFTGALDDDADFLLLYAAIAYALRERACLALGVPLDTGDLDSLLTYRVWESSSNVQSYRDAVKRDLFPSFGQYIDSVPDRRPFYAEEDVTITELMYVLCMSGAEGRLHKYWGNIPGMEPLWHKRSE